jgi:hypothetical protein
MLKKESEQMKAFRIYVESFPTGILAAESRGKAQYKAFTDLTEEAGYTGYKFTDIRVTRAPEFDEWARKPKRRAVYTEEILIKQLQRESNV